MKLFLPLKSFAFFKAGTGLLFLASVATLPASVGMVYLMAIALAKSHLIGAWFAMWRAGKLTKIYIAWMLFFSVFFSYIAAAVVPLLLLTFLTSLLFLFHFLFDEFEFQEQHEVKINLISGIAPGILGTMFLFSDYFSLQALLVPSIYVIIFVALFFIELLYIRHIDWFFIQTKIFSLFLLFAVFFEIDSVIIFLIFSLYHYIFWFIYPAYKLHKYKREERDGFIFIMLLLIAGNFYYGAAGIMDNQAMSEIAVKAFLVGTIVHILSTAPFGYFFGLKRSSYQISQKR